MRWTLRCSCRRNPESHTDALRQRVREVQQRMLDQRSADTELLAVRVAEGETTAVTATVLGPRSLSRRSIDQLNGELSETIGRPTRLIVRSVPSTRVGASRAARAAQPAKAAR